MYDNRRLSLSLQFGPSEAGDKPGIPIPHFHPILELEDKGLHAPPVILINVLFPIGCLVTVDDRMVKIKSRRTEERF
jgi:hypothetical protein